MLLKYRADVRDDPIALGSVDRVAAELQPPVSG